MTHKKLKKAELELAKSQLLARKKELEEQLSELATQKVSDDQVQDVGDQVLSSVMEALRNSLQDAEYQEYVRIIQALQAIEKGTYGLCVDCGEQISEKRLKYYPNASRCIACQEANEAGKV
jgi:DnaK suppressor protein